MSKISLFLKGILIGFASLAIPGLSASTIAIVLFVYYDMIYAISHIFKKPKKSITFLAVLIAGYGVGALAGAVAVNTLYINFPVPVVAAVLGFLIGSIPRMAVESRNDFKKPVNLLIMILTAAVFLVYAFVVNSGNSVSFDVIRFPRDYILMALVGVVTSTTLVIPGVDFAVTLMALGYYYAFIDLVGNFPALILHPSRLFILLAYLIGYGVGSFFLSKGLRFLIKRYPRQLQCVNLAMVIIAPVIVFGKCVIFDDNFKAHETGPQFVWAVALFAAGFFAYSWVPFLLRYFGIVPRDPAETAATAARAARCDIPPEQMHELVQEAKAAEHAATRDVTCTDDPPQKTDASSAPDDPAQ